MLGAAIAGAWNFEMWVAQGLAIAVLMFSNEADPEMGHGDKVLVR